MDEIKIYIDDDGDYNEFAIALQDKLQKYFKGNISVETFADLKPKGSTEIQVLNAINKANIIIPLLSPNYLNYATEKVITGFEGIIDNQAKFLLPFHYRTSSWSSHKWVVKSNVFPDDEVGYMELSESKKEAVFAKLFSRVERIIETNTTRKSKPTLVHKTSEETKTVFISHSHDDADFAELLTLQFEKNGIKSWIDTAELKVGQNWREEIDGGIHNSIALIAIMSPSARQSEYVTYEWAYAWGKGVKVFPVMLKQTALHPRLESLQYLDFTNRNTRPWDELMTSIKGLL